MDTKHFLQSKTFWFALSGFVIEIATQFQGFPLSTGAAHVVSAILMVAIALNRALKNFSFSNEPSDFQG